VTEARSNSSRPTSRPASASPRKPTASPSTQAHQTEQPEPLAELRPDLPAELVEVIERLMQKAPEDRYSSAEEIIELLRPLARTTLPSALPERKPEPVTQPVEPVEPTEPVEPKITEEPQDNDEEETPERWPWLAPLVVVLGVLILGAGAGFAAAKWFGN
jgi:hypothetical protein